MPMHTREVHLAKRPDGVPGDEHFRLVDADLREPGDGDVLVRNLWMSVDPYMRPRMDDVPSYIPPFVVGEALDGAAVGEVIVSGSDRLAVGDLVLHNLGWREHAVLRDRAARLLGKDGPSPSAYLGILGAPGLTAWVGLLDIADLRDGDVVFVSGAAGAVGSAAAQIAKLRGHRVIGSAGSPEKVRYLLEDLGLDAAFNYRDGTPTDLLRDAAPDGIDVYFDNVGGDHLEAAIDSLHDHGRVAMCGAIAQYNATEPTAAPRNLWNAVAKRLSLRGFIIMDHMRRTPEFLQEVEPLVREGRITYRETVVDGLDNAPRALRGVLRGDNTGKMVVRL